MTVEGLRLYLGTSPWVLRYGSTHKGARKAMQFFLGWGIPFCITITAATVGGYFDIYLRQSPLYEALHNASEENLRASRVRRYDICWLDQEALLYYLTVTTPIALVLLINIGITCIVSNSQYLPTLVNKLLLLKCDCGFSIRTLV